MSDFSGGVGGSLAITGARITNDGTMPLAAGAARLRRDDQRRCHQLREGVNRDAVDTDVAIPIAAAA